MSAEEGQSSAAEETNTASAALRPTIRWTAQAAGGTVAFSPDGARVATGSAGQEQAKLLAASNGAVVQTLAVEGPPNAAAYSRDGRFIAIGTALNVLNLTVYDLTTETLLFQKTGHNNGTLSVSFSPTNPTQFATGGRDKTVANTKFWSTDGTILRSLNDASRVFAVSYSPDGANVASNASGHVHIWRVADGALLRTIEATNHNALAYSPDGTIISTGTQLFNAATGALIRNLTLPTGSVTSTTFTRDGRAVVVAGEDFPNNIDVPTIRYFRVSDGATLVTFNQQLGGSTTAYIKAVAISPDGASLAYATNDNLTVLAASPF
jgi:WD40 repeat protein